MFKKKFGQNFLVDQSVVRKIIKAISDEFEEICEIGPGHGALTNSLLIAGKKVQAVEIDLDCIDILKKKFANEISEKRLNIIHKDALQYVFKHKCVVGNLPYNVGTKIIENFVYNPIATGVFMLQKEVAKRMNSHVTEKDYSALSVFVQSRYNISKICNVSPDAFVPKPKVESQIIKLVANGVEEYDYNKLSRILRLVFAFPRKKIGFLKKSNPELLNQLLEFGIDHNVRASFIPKQIFYELARKFR